jgi:UDP-N-acetylglucosamine--N-acetylmuramyl-(pentapeptide) pyrophosphoryl-undecaprenol N-acetylglucosamine transferase
VVPAIAIADALRDSGRARVSFIGTRDRAEAELVPAAGYEIEFLDVKGLDRRNPLRAAIAVGKAARAIGAARKLLTARNADVVLGGGGYVAGPAGWAAARMGLPLVLTEADSHLGLANRLLAGRATRVCLAFPIPGREGDPYLVTGRPVPRDVLDADPSSARRSFGIPESARCVALFGGSLGALTINRAAQAAFGGAEGAGDPWILHVAGSRDYPELRASARLGGGRPPRALPADRVRALVR